MHFRLQLIAVLDDGTEHLQEVADVARPATTLETLGLTLDESKCLLEQVQHTMIEYQVAGYLDPLRGCPDCGKNRRLKDSNRALSRTTESGLFRKLCGGCNLRGNPSLLNGPIYREFNHLRRVIAPPDLIFTQFAEQPFSSRGFPYF